MNPILIVFAGFAVRKLANILPKMLLARALTPEEFGLFYLAFTTFTLATILGVYGLPDAAVRHISFALGRKKKEGISIAVKDSLRTLFLLSFVTAAILSLSSNFIAQAYHSPQVAFLLKMFAVLIPLEAIILYSRALTRTLQRFKVWFLLEVIRPALFFWFILASLITFETALKSLWLAYALSGLLALAVVYSFMKNLVKTNKTRIRKYLRFALPMFATTSLTCLIGTVDTVMLGVLRTPIEVGLYEAAITLVILFSLVPTALNKIFLPRASKLLGENRTQEIFREYKKFRKYALILTIPALFFYVLFSTQLLEIFFGLPYAPAATALSILAVGYAIAAMTGQAGQMLVTYAKTKLFFKIMMFWQTIDIAMSLVLIPAYGIVGAATASAISLAAINFHLVYEVKKMERKP